MCQCPIDTSTIMNVTMVQRYIFYADILMNVFAMVNVVTMQHHIFYVDILLDVFVMVGVVTM